MTVVRKSVATFFLITKNISGFKNCENTKTLILTQKLKMWQSPKTPVMAKVQISNCDKSQKLKLWQKSKTPIVTLLKQIKISIYIFYQFLAALSISRSLVVRPLVGPSVCDICEKATFRVSKGN